MDPILVGGIFTAALFAVVVIPLKFLEIVRSNGWQFSLRALLEFVTCEAIAFGVAAWLIRVWFAAPIPTP